MRYCFVSESETFSVPFAVPPLVAGHDVQPGPVSVHVIVVALLNEQEIETATAPSVHVSVPVNVKEVPLFVPVVPKLPLLPGIVALTAVPLCVIGMEMDPVADCVPQVAELFEPLVGPAHVPVAS